MADAKSTSKSTSSTPKNVIQQPTTAPRAAKEIPVDTNQEYDAKAETEGLGEEGFRNVGDEVVRSARHEARAQADNG